MNPVRAGMMTHPGDYPWSSYRANGRGNADGLIVPHELYQNLGRTNEERQATYWQLCQAQLTNADVAAIRNATNKGWGWAIAAFARRWRHSRSDGQCRCHETGRNVRGKLN
ncbi:hypothetical protein [Candidatus Nitrotoga sp. HW29]|uniref:hypothetical protein n=1 Tax=Candidatus Nitrotoga sp. HW29 TaxID=2886963 RepID=UPI001EF18609|nr:hypothetical protein [Candidatus Nitrotoga sp. HW29]